MANGFNPSGMWGPSGRAFSQGVVAPEGHTVHITGQVAWDENDEVVGLGDAAAQMEKCIENTARVLADVGGTLDDIVSLTIYFTDRNDIVPLREVRMRHFKDGTAPVSIVIQVAGLIIPEFLVELVPVAVIPPGRFNQPG